LKNKDIRKLTAEQFKKMREALKMTQQEMADQMDIVRPSVAKYEMGESFPGPEGLSLLAHRYGVSLDWLIAGKGPLFYEEKRPLTANESQYQKDIGELLDYMDDVPLFRFKVLSFFHQFMYDHPDLPKGKE
jgi:transcriptional regulator with XRE-family HTH domain